MSYRTLANPYEGQPPRDTASDRALVLSTAWRYVLTPRMLEASMVHVHEDVTRYRRALHTIVQRVPQLRCIPSGAVSVDRAARIDPEDIDPWQLDPEQTSANTMHVRTCPLCDGKRSCECSDCSGSARVTCPDCNGSRRDANNRGCAICGASGTVSCGECNLGRVPCTECDAGGIVEAWIHVEESLKELVHVDGAGPTTEVHSTLFQATDFDNAASWPNPMVDERTFEGAPFEDTALQPVLNAMTDRLIRTRVQTFEGRTTAFDYQTRTGSGKISVAGAPPAILSSSNFQPLLRRRAGLLAVLVIGALGSLFARGRYVGQHTWYRQYGSPGAVWLSALALAFSVVFAVALFTCLPRARSRRVSLVSAGLVPTSLLALILAWNLRGPSLAHATTLLHAGTFEAARVEFEAAEKSAGAAGHLDKLLLDRFEQAPSLDAKSKLLDGNEWTDTAKPEASHRFHVLANVEHDRIKDDPTALRALAVTVARHGDRLTEQYLDEASLLEINRAFELFERAAPHERVERLLAAATLYEATRDELSWTHFMELARRMCNAMDAVGRERMRVAAQEATAEARLTAWNQAEIMLTAAQKARTIGKLPEPDGTAKLLQRVREEHEKARRAASKSQLRAK